MERCVHHRKNKKNLTKEGRKVPEYNYKAITSKGQVVKNRVEDVNRNTLIKKLKNNDLLPISRLCKYFTRTRYGKAYIKRKSKSSFIKRRKNNNKRYYNFYSKFLFTKKGKLQQYTCIKYNYRQYR